MSICRASARKARQVAQEQKRLEEKLKQEELARKEREAAELRAAKKRKLDVCIIIHEFIFWKVSSLVNVQQQQKPL
jgi:alkylhydroperoxidase family enzyme